MTLIALTLIACTGGRMRSMVAREPAASRVDTFSVAMPELGGRSRTVRVYLPPGYDASSSRYPVLYLQDAQQLFSPGPFGDWQVDEHLDRMVEDGRLRGLIVVGVDNSEHRWDEYGPWVTTHMREWVMPSWSQPVQGGEGDAYIRFLTGTLKPMIDARFRTLRDREHTGIGGSSMGGLIALHAGLTRPEVFSRVMAMSTATWFGEDGGPWLSSNRLLRDVRERPVPANVRFYLDVGTNERSRDSDPDVRDALGRPVSYPRAYVEGSEAVAEALSARGVPPERLRHLVDHGGIHNESAWSARFEAAIEWLYQ
jgi:pullulanase